MTAIGVLCARVRVEEKQIIAALAEAGHAAMPVPPASTPLPPGPALLDLAALDISDSHQREEGSQLNMSVIIDRCQNRHLAAVMLPLLETAGMQTIDAGLASVGTRLQIATALSQAGLPRPAAFVGFSEASAMEAAARLGFPATLMPQTPGTASTPLLDHDTAEAVIEHRVVLGALGEAIVLLQAGAPQTDQVGRHHVVGGEVIAVEGSLVNSEAQVLAVEAARTLGAQTVAIDIAHIDGRLVIWDAVAVADFRAATLTGPRSVAEALADSTVGAAFPLSSQSNGSTAGDRQEWEVQVRHGVGNVSLTA